MVRLLLGAMAGLFAIVAGANDGGSILSAGLGVSRLRPITSVGLLLAAIAVGPLLFGTGVATTLVHGLVLFGPGRTGELALLVAVASAVLVVSGFSLAGLPTSLTLAIVGAIVGAGVGFGLHVGVVTIVVVVGLGLVAPIVSALLAYGVARIPLRSIRSRDSSRGLRRVHFAAYIAQCLAYSLNGGQKMLAVAAVAAGLVAGGTVHDSLYDAIGLTALFGLGVIFSLRRVGTSLGRGIYRVRLRHTVIAETCATAVVLASGWVGVPLTMSQSVAGALMGAGASEGPRRIRWTSALRIAGAWCVTVPAALCLAALAGASFRLSP